MSCVRSNRHEQETDLRSSSYRNSVHDSELPEKVSLQSVSARSTGEFDSRNTLGAHSRHVVEDSTEMFFVGEDIFLKRQGSSSTLDWIGQGRVSTTLTWKLEVVATDSPRYTQGSLFCWAISCARRCFLTVIGW